jgi:hypothetical protein
MKRTFALLMSLCLAACAAYAQPDPLSTQIDGIVAELTKISGLARLHKIEYDRIAKGQVKQFLEEQAKEELKPEELRAEELALKKFGFVPADFDLKKTMIELLTEQAAAFYDPRKHKLFVIESTPDLVQRLALVHELAHALADQHFHLGKFIEKSNPKDDSALARTAVMEGQATWLMFEQFSRSGGQSLRNSNGLAALMSQTAELAAGQYPVFGHAPLYIRESLLFPYTQGFLFQQAVVAKLDQAAFAEVFRNPPVSTQQILHPEKYFAGTRPVVPPLPQLDNRRAWRVLGEGAVGEFDHSILLRQYAGEKEAAEISPNLTGGVYQILENKADGRLVLAYASEWTNAAVARKYFGLYLRVLKGKWKNFRVDSESGSAVSGRGDDGYFLLRCEGSRVASLEGLSAPPAAPAPSNRIH